MRSTMALGLVMTLLTGCAAGPDGGGAATGAMGMGGDSGAWAGTGVVAAKGEALIELAEPTPAGAAGVAVRRVVSPADGWLVLRAADEPGAVLGRVPVARGENGPMVVRPAFITGRKATLGLHVDRGTRGRFEFIPGREERSADGEVFVARRAVREPVELSGYGVDVEANSALILVEDQTLAPGAPLRVAYLIVDRRSWIVVNELRDGVAGAMVGAAERPAGEWHEIDVELDRRPATGSVLVTVLADRPPAGSLDVIDGEPMASADQPLVSAGVIVARRISVR